MGQIIFKHVDETFNNFVVTIRVRGIIFAAKCSYYLIVKNYYILNGYYATLISK